MNSEDEDLLKTARERFDKAVEAERTIRQEARKDMQYLTGDQWDPLEVKARNDANRPHLTVNKLPQFVDQVVNEGRRNRPGAQVTAVGGGADPDTADICEGMMRHIDYDSHAEIAYDTAFESSASCSFGYWRYTTEYCDEESFDQDIKVVPVMDAFAVYMDCYAVLPDRSDAMWAFVISTLSKDEFKRRYPDAETTVSGFYDEAGCRDNPAPEWIKSDGIRVAEYWTVEVERRTLRMYSDNVGRFDDDDRPIPKGVTVVKERTSEKRTVKQYVINGAEVLERSDWAGRWIPIVPVFGKQISYEGQRHIMSLIRFARDPQALFNYYKTAQAEMVGISPKVPWVGYVGQFKTRRADWEDANVHPFPFLEVDPVTVDGQPAPLPQRNTFEPPIQALSVGALQSSDDIKATTGMFDPSLGANKNDQSGEAIKALQAEGNTSNFHLVDNLTRSLWHGYRIVLDLLPKIYDAPRAQRIIKPDHSSEVVLINQIFQDKKTGQQKNHDLSIGKYDVVVSVGPGYETRRQAARDHLADLAKADPASLSQWADLFVKELDLGPIGDQIAERLTPPQYRDQSDPAQQNMMAQQKLQQAGLMISQLSGVVHQLKDEIDAKQIECESRERIAAMQEETKRVLGLAALDQKDGLALLASDITATKHRVEMTQQAAIQQADQEHQANMAGQQQQAAQQQQQADHAHQAQQATQAQQAAAQQQESAQQAAAEQQAAAQQQESEAA